ncbi:C4-dicarboxylate ABC transporter [Desulfosarcina alkanivorans]|jgi:TRAP-type mannitol/chloroaromatic compound transport system substrate-binding protein|uniref:C4-dicarboxylate ABC transporter n=1 Tax=Desulfosarcina alkanivorans TaxID=571177 RepID=A0A5K7YJK9_9BACT|nr:TRAP transporter substrate-binding protein DctP [Desulfosarcina alkanivorans]BBO69862.1 C4-dicarboxylate ABC transporter [Desulfosarcina alkanivorans]
MNVQRNLSRYFLSAILFFCVGLIAANVAAEEKNWKMTTCWPPSIKFIEADRHFVNLVNEHMGGQLKIKFFEGGSLVPAFELLDAVSNGVVQAGGDWPNYWAGKNSAFDLLGAYPMGLTPNDYFVWIYQGGGFELYQELYAQFGIVYLPYWVSTSESGVRGNKKITSLEDYKGMKIRMSGQTQGKILKDLGASQVMMAGGEIYQALEKGVIDAGEFSDPANDWSLGFQEIAKYWASPGWHQPGSVGGVMINKKAWDSLPEKSQKLMVTLAKETFGWTYAFYEYSSVNATHKFIDAGIEITRISDADLDKIQELAYKHLLESSKKNPMFARIAHAQLEFLQKSAKWRSVASPFTSGRNPKLPDMDAIKSCIK